MVRSKYNFIIFIYLQFQIVCVFAKYDLFKLTIFIQNWINMNLYQFLETGTSDITFMGRYQLKWLAFSLYSPFKGTTVMNQALPSLNGGKLKLTLTVPLKNIYWQHDSILLPLFLVCERSIPDSVTEFLLGLFCAQFFFRKS